MEMMKKLKKKTIFEKKLTENIRWRNCNKKKKTNYAKK